MSSSRRIRILPEAVADLERLREFIRVHNPAAASRAAQRIREGIKNLLNHPFLGRAVADIDNPALRDLYVSFGQGGYWIRYLVTKETIDIIKIWHGREDCL